MISPDLLAAFWLFAIVASGSPGPATVMALAAGANVGFRGSLPLVFGTAAGVGLMLVAVGLGLGAVFRAAPWLHETLRYAGAAFLVYLAWRIARSGRFRDDAESRPPLGFFGGVAFQWVNAKAWIVLVSAAATYVPQQQFVMNVMLLAAVFGLTALLTIGAWAAFGSRLRGFLRNPKAARWFNYIAAAALVLSIIPILMN